MGLSVSRAVLLFFTALSFLFIRSAYAEPADPAEFVGHMTDFQYFLHKTGLAIDAKNQDLVDFYAHEIGETLNAAAQLEYYAGYPTKALLLSMLLPTVKNFRLMIPEGDFNKLSNEFDNLVQACNACHMATKHEFIRIQRVHTNPFMQSFEPLKK